MGAEYVGWHEVRRELDALGVQFEDFGEGADEGGLAEPGEAFEEDVPAREHAREDEAVQLGAPEQHGVERREDSVEVRLDALNFRRVQQSHFM